MECLGHFDDVQLFPLKNAKRPSLIVHPGGCSKPKPKGML